MKRTIITALAVLSCASALAQRNTGLSTGEYFMGAAAGYGYLMPVGDKNFRISVDDAVNANLTSPLMVSTTGRYVFAERPIQLSSSRNSMSMKDSCNVQSGGNTLRHAFLTAVSKNMAPDGKIPPEEFFAAPIVNTWSALGSELSQDAVKEFVGNIQSNGLKPGIIVIDNGWQGHNGSYEFDVRSFPDPAELVSWLHSKGMKVMLQVTPMISPDCLDFMKFRSAGRLEKNNGGLPRIVEWYGGYSAILDISQPDNVEYIKSRIDELVSKYGIDGFKFDFVSGDNYPSVEEYLSHTVPWTTLASDYRYHMISGAYKSSGVTLVGQLTCRRPVWSSMPLMLAEAVNAGICGYPFVVPDPVGGGFVLSDKESEFDPDFFIRCAQLQAFMPFMHFSAMPEGILTEARKKLVKDAISLHEELLPYIKELAAAAVNTGEPVIHHMEYNFPARGFYDCNDQFMLGSRYLVAPVMSPDGKRTVRLPAGVWVDDAGKRYKGPAVIPVQVPIDRILYFKLLKEAKDNKKN